ncbi:Plant disease resistance response protein [Corchorus olitorius]|uniref:Dirigent protein n=1 Tax=Corchorus olitorius TaxID=93759 RepID=A0A1R3KQ12_9ROSI|nr:Plant disease resistance response protein [Corchorus olitorius]
MSKQVSPVFITLLIAAVYMATCLAQINPGGAGVGAVNPGGAAAGATATATTAGTAEEPILEFYMHDILGGSSPTARPITGILGNIYSGQVPFAKRVGFLPPQNGVAIPNANGAVPTVNGINGLPLGTGLAGTAFAGNPNQNGNPQIPLGPDGLGLGFGTITVIDDILTNSPDLGSQAIGKAQGVYVASSADGATQMMAFTAMIEGGEYNDNLNFYGVYKIGSVMSHISVTGGTGRFKNACGIAEVRPLIPPGQHVTDGAETLLRVTVQLKY